MVQVIQTDYVPGPNTLSVFAEFPKTVPNPAVDGGHFERVSSSPIIPLPATGKVAIVNQATGINTGTDTFTYTGDNPTNGIPCKLTSTVTLPTGPIPGGIAYFINVNTGAKTFQLAIKPADVGGNTPINITAAGTGTLTVTEYYFDRIYLNQAMEDPKRGRILALAHARTPGATDTDGAKGRNIYLLSAPWRHPEGPWTWLTDPASGGLITKSGWKADNVYMSCGFIAGDILNIAYGGGNRDAGPPVIIKIRTGLATVNLNTLAVTDLSAANCLTLGTTPYEAVPAGLYQKDGRVNLHVGVQNATGSAAEMPRHYRNISFAVTGWTIHPSMVEYGNPSPENGMDTAFSNCIPMVDGSVIAPRWKQYGGYNGEPLTSPPTFSAIRQYSYDGSTVVISEMARLMHWNDTTGQWDDWQCDSNQLFYHLGDWYDFYAGNTNAGYLAGGDGTTNAQGSQVGCAKYTTTGTAETQAALGDWTAPVVNEYPTSWVSGTTANVDKLIPAGTVTVDLGSGICGNTIDLSTRGKLKLDGGSLTDLTGNPGFKVIQHVAIGAANGGGYMAGVYGYSGGTFKLNMRYPTISHTHTYTVSPTDAYPTGGASGAVGAHPAIGISSVSSILRITGKSV